MSMSSWVFVETYNSLKHEWEYAHPYVKDRYAEGCFKRVDLDYGSNHILFSILDADSRYNSNYTMEEINYELPDDVSKELKEEEEIIADAETEKTRGVTYRWFPLSELYIETIEHPTIKAEDIDYPIDEEERINPLCALYKDVYTIAKLYCDNYTWNENIRTNTRVIICTSY